VADLLDFGWRKKEKTERKNFTLISLLAFTVRLHATSQAES
jgi:hypothetical protein